jgi:hypothetical protein
MRNRLDGKCYCMHLHSRLDATSRNDLGIPQLNHTNKLKRKHQHETTLDLQQTASSHFSDFSQSQTFHILIGPKATPLIR